LSSWKIGDGSFIYFWNDKWNDNVTVDELNFYESMDGNLSVKVSDFIQNGAWSFGYYRRPLDLTSMPNLISIMNQN